MHGVAAPGISAFAVEMRKQNLWIAAICVHDPSLIRPPVKVRIIAVGVKHDAISIRRPSGLIAANAVWLDGKLCSVCAIRIHYPNVAIFRFISTQEDNLRSIR